MSHWASEEIGVLLNELLPEVRVQAAKIKCDDILFSFDGTESTCLQGSMKALGESGLGKESTGVVECFGKKRTIVVTPN